MHTSTRALQISASTAAVILFSFLSPDLVSAQGQFVPLAGIPGISTGPNTNLVTYLNAIYTLLIVVGALIAVVKIALAGAKYAMSDVITDKSEAKKDIQGVLIGLAILLLPAVVLGTIYPNLINLNVLQNAKPINQNVTGPATQTSQTKLEVVSASDVAKRLDECDARDGKYTYMGSGNFTCTVNTVQNSSPLNDIKDEALRKQVEEYLKLDVTDAMQLRANAVATSAGINSQIFISQFNSKTFETCQKIGGREAKFPNGQNTYMVCGK